MHEWRSKLKGKTIATAESCTGGRIAAAITAVSGASDYFQGSIVAYQNEVKEKMLGVPHAMIVEHDVVSKEVVEAMVKGACRLFHTDYAVASTGYAEPWGDNAVKIWIGWGTEDDVHSLCLTEDNGRLANVECATERVLQEFELYILNK